MGAHLYRISASQNELRDIGVLARGLQRHLFDQPLLSTLVQIGNRQQAYVALRGCERCHSIDSCVPGCRVELLRRTLQGAFGASCQLSHVSNGLAERDYTRAVLARPKPGALGLDGELLHPYTDARLTLHWRAVGKGPQRMAAVLAVGQDGPEPAGFMAEYGWDTIDAPRPLVRYAGSLFGVYSWPFPVTAVWPGEPRLLIASTEASPARVSSVAGPVPRATSARMMLSDSGEQTVALDIVTTEGQEQSELRAATYTQLKSILSKSLAVSADQPAPMPLEHADAAAGMFSKSLVVSPWPQGPGEGRSAMSPTDVELCVLAGLTSPGMQPTESGLTRRRIARVLDERHKEHAGVLLVWFEAAGLLSPPVDPSQPYRHPRWFTCVDPVTIAAQLRAHPLPTSNNIAVAKAHGL